MFSHFKYSLGANLGVKNGSIVAFDVGYWLGLSEGLEKIINADPLPLTEKKLELLKRNCESIKKATENINLDPTDESINDKLKLIKDGVHIKYVSLVTLVRFGLFSRKKKSKIRNCKTFLKIEFCEKKYFVYAWPMQHGCSRHFFLNRKL